VRQTDEPIWGPVIPLTCQPAAASISRLTLCTVPTPQATSFAVLSVVQRIRTQLATGAGNVSDTKRSPGAQRS
jgi:hypothetical protein